MINGLKLTDKSLIANSFCEYFSTIARNLKSKSILLRDFVWSNPAEENLSIQVTESQFSFKAVKESEVLKSGGQKISSIWWQNSWNQFRSFSGYKKALKKKTNLTPLVFSRSA